MAFGILRFVLMLFPHLLGWGSGQEIVVVPWAASCWPLMEFCFMGVWGGGRHRLLGRVLSTLRPCPLPDESPPGARTSWRPHSIASVTQHRAAT